jgi:flagellar biosynthetic protein FliQ
VQLVELAQQALLLALTLSVPALAAGLVAGVLAGLVATAARLHDPALTALPRQLAVAAALLASGAAGATAIVRFARSVWAAIPTLVR